MESSDEALLNVQGLLLYNVTDDVQCGYVDLLESVRMEFNLPPYFKLDTSSRCLMRSLARDMDFFAKYRTSLSPPFSRDFSLVS